MRIFFSVGEPSGDLHGANLIHQLRQRRPDIELTGYGGPRMKAAGCQLEADLTRLAVMWFLSVLVNLGRFWKLWRRARRIFGDPQRRPDAVVLIDYPGFNWWIASAARRHGIPVFYYGVPQMWAWASWRVGKMRRLVDHVLCKLPFEAEWYRERGCDAQHVGHPYFDEVSQRQLDGQFLAELQRGTHPLLLLLPGSRKAEVAKNGPGLLDAAAHVRRQVERVRLAAACFNQEQAAMLREQAAERGVDIDIHVGRTPELIEAARCCLACSGSVSLELMCAAKPTVILYKMSFLQYRLGQLLIQVKYITLVNLLAMEDRFERQWKPLDYDPQRQQEQAPMPEYPHYLDRSRQLARHAVIWLTDPAEHAAAAARLRQLREQFAQPGASARAADYLLATLDEAAPRRRAA